MQIDKIHLKGFRNFDNEEIVLQKKTLIIGANDVGKTNLLYALRLLFDKSINEHDLELSDSDYNAYSNASSIEITATLCDVTEDCLLSAFAGAVKDGTLIIRYTNSKGGSYKIFIGYSEDTLYEIPARQYIKRLNMQCVDTNRDLFSFLRREKAKMLQLSKEKATPDATDEDKHTIANIQASLDTINNQISSLHYVSSALENVNSELSDLSIHNEDQLVRFVAGNSAADKILDDLVLAYSSGETPLSIGGDGRNNQIFLATWIAKQRMQENVDHVTIYAIEEPEAHLHPHQQRKLSEYIQKNFSEQIIVTSHSPHIASKFEPGSIVRLYSKNKLTFAACGGCSQALKTVYSNFGYRLNALSSETFFSDAVFLVEGASEVLFFTALAQEIGVDLDRYNISILSVEGIGFKPYVAICDALSIPWALRTDNDIFSKPTKAPTKKYYAGITRAMGIIEQIGDKETGLLEYWKNFNEKNEWLLNEDIPEEAKTLNSYCREHLKQLGIYISDIDLEYDLANSVLRPQLLSFYNKRATSTLVKAMQTKKAENMFSFLIANHSFLSGLKDTAIATPLISLKKLVAERVHPNEN